jgi:hypothetical protein
MARNYRFGELNEIRRSTTRKAYNPSTYDPLQNVFQNSEGTFNPSAAANISSVFSAQVVGLVGIGPVHPDKFPLFFKIMVDQYGSDVDGHPSFFQVWVRSPELNSEAPSPASHIADLKDNDPLNEFQHLAMFPEPIIGGVFSTTTLKAKIGDIVKVSYFDTITGAEPLVREGAMASVGTPTTAGTENTRRGYNNTEPQDGVSPTSGTPGAASTGAPAGVQPTTTEEICERQENQEFIQKYMESIAAINTGTATARYTNDLAGFEEYYAAVRTLIGTAANTIDSEYNHRHYTEFRHQSVARGIYPVRSAGASQRLEGKIKGNVFQDGGKMHALPDPEYWSLVAPLITIVELLYNDPRITFAGIRNWWRPEEYNAEPTTVNGGTNSAHLYGKALDIDFSSFDATDVAQERLYSLWFCVPGIVMGLGFGDDEVHVDFNQFRHRRGWLYNSFRNYARPRTGSYSTSWNYLT